MELLLLGLGALGGLALLLQSKDLPSKADYEAALVKVKDSPTDPVLNTTIGKYLAFVEGKYNEAMPFLVNSKDATLKKLAEHEMDPKHTETAPQKVGMGDEWIKAAQNNRKLSEIFYDRAAQWYTLGWPDLDPVWKDRARIQGQKLSVARPQGRSQKGLPAGWVSGTENVGGVSPEIDGAFSRSGSHSAKLLPSIKGVNSVLRSDFIPVTGKTIEVTAYVRTDGTESAGDAISIWYFDENGTRRDMPSVAVLKDTPFWNKVTIRQNVPAYASKAKFNAVMVSKEGSMWVDDVSVKFVDDKGVVKEELNTSFEGR